MQCVNAIKMYRKAGFADVHVQQLVYTRIDGIFLDKNNEFTYLIMYMHVQCTYTLMTHTHCMRHCVLYLYMYMNN